MYDSEEAEEVKASLRPRPLSFNPRSNDFVHRNQCVPMRFER